MFTVGGFALEELWHIPYRTYIGRGKQAREIQRAHRTFLVLRSERSDIEPAVVRHVAGCGRGHETSRTASHVALTSHTIDALDRSTAVHSAHGGDRTRDHSRTPSASYIDSRVRNDEELQLDGQRRQSELFGGFQKRRGGMTRAHS